MKQMFVILAGSLLVATASFAQTDTTASHKTVVHKHTETHHTTTASTTQPAATTVTHHHATKAHNAQSSGGTEVTTDSTSVHKHVKKPA